MDELILLPENQAVRTFFDDINRSVLYRLLGGVTAALLVMFFILAIEGQYLALIVPAVSLVLVRALYSLRDTPWLRRHFPPTLVTYLVAQPLLIRLLFIHWEAVYLPGDVFLAAPILFFRLRSSFTALVVSVMWAVTAGRDLLLSVLREDHELDLVWLSAITALSVALYIVSRSITRRRLEDFLDRWRREHQRHRERLRMREELDQARRIQLSMLPRSDPTSTWLDIAGISIPASEVGGDYYEYFKVDDIRQAVVVADVAGHGVASGLLLATVRGCLYLLKESPHSPSEVLGKIDRVVRETTGKRNFVTMIYALFDRDRHVVRVACAGHPPMLRYVAATGNVEEIGFDALPLGTALQQEIREVEVAFKPDDILIFYTDGIAETVSSRGEVYGTERLAKRLRKTDHDRTAKEIRDTLLGDVWSFKADGEQNDDITLVVLKIL
ncbi:MAG: PP2C family protein-serine/threonine phosphatase [Thermoanaerobaculia bacterium]|nr:PP2C family protein-serine/threonine phosphatase [Thermoanaerobaculia bacterium]